MKAIVVVVLAMLMAACSPSLMNKGNGSLIETRTSKTESIEYKSHAVLLSDLTEKAKLNMWDTETVQRKAVGLPQGGYVVFRVSRFSIESADSRWFTGIVSQSGREVARWEWDSSIPSPDVNYSGWLNVMVMPISRPMHMPFDVYLVDNLNNERSHWRITPR